MTKVFVDTAAWLALINADDTFHQKAKAVRTELLQSKADFVTTDQVLIEVANGLSSPRFRVAAVQLLEAIEQSPNIRIIRTARRIYGGSLHRDSPICTKVWDGVECV
ncbi:PIN domain-containing protein [Candidatus Acetothermia bacterium]|jgi:predicted nucleic acid-binding protein|nr:PIN domain-containing protein [Candidatus Acetothermia bacterium]MCI2436897.1 PIN domain-containing protein [Candidatus Acetothermia bacterium]